MNAKQRVFIIDSDLKNCKAIKYALTEYDIGAYYTLSVIDGIERLTRHNYELVILDISLSETDGFQLLRFMRQRKICRFWCCPFRAVLNTRREHSDKTGA
ncbi:MULTISPECIES: response regulator [Clostridia]|uniref:response regulator n=1 Tax=Clostridia TaxID=186801 RepID=UPI00067EED40|nr:MULTISPECIES: response regulator [Clostridia]